MRTKRRETPKLFPASVAPPHVCDTSHSGGDFVDQSTVRCHRSLRTNDPEVRSIPLSINQKTKRKRKKKEKMYTIVPENIVIGGWFFLLILPNLNIFPGPLKGQKKPAHVHGTVIVHVDNADRVLPPNCSICCNVMWAHRTCPARWYVSAFLSGTQLFCPIHLAAILDRCSAQLDALWAPHPSLPTASTF